MPIKPKKPCAYPNCPNLTHDRFCEQHKQTENRRYNKYQRNPAINKRYGKEWKRISKAYRQAHPLCELCQEAGRITRAECVHHKKKIADGGGNDYDNLQALCLACHSRIHCQEGDSLNKR